MHDRILSLILFAVILVSVFVAEYQGHPITAITMALLGIFVALWRIERQLLRGAEWLERATRPEKDKGTDVA